MEAARTDEREGYARLLAEFVTVQVSIHDGAEITSDDIDSLIEAEDMLVHLDSGNGNTFEYEFELPDLIGVLSDLNEGFRIEAPCMNADNAGVFEVDAPLDARPDKYRPRHEVPTILGASTEDSADNSDDRDAGFHRPKHPTRPAPAIKVTKRQVFE